MPPSTTTLDFQGLASRLLADARSLLPSWLPGGKLVGKEYECSNLQGGQGSSLKVNVETGRWSDFATADLAGGDLVSLYAAIQGISQGDTFRRLSESTSYAPSKLPAKPRTDDLKLTPPPADAPPPPLILTTGQRPSMSWVYRTPKGEPIFHVARYDGPTGKQILPYSWSSVRKGWVQKGFPSPRPLYGLERLAAAPDASVLVVEGEKAADAARKLTSSYVVITWPNGSNAYSKADWAPVFGRKVLIWPDADEPGMTAANEIAAMLHSHCKEVKVIDASDHKDGWDAADAVAEGWGWDQFLAWAKPRAKVYVPPDKPPVTKTTAPLQVAAKQANIMTTGPVTVTPSDDDGPPASSTMIQLYQDLGLAVTSQFKPITNADNVLRILTKYDPLKGLLWFDEFHMKFFTVITLDKSGRLTADKAAKPREWKDSDENDLMIFLQRELGLTSMSIEVVHQGCVAYATRNRRNEPRDWMDSLKWDGNPRIDTLFPEYFGSELSEYTNCVSRNFMLSMVARIYSPGCQQDYMVVLEGGQGIGKTRGLDTLAHPWHVESHHSVQEKDFFLMMQGKLLIEIAELDGFSKSEVTRIKQAISCRDDRFRAPYARSMQNYPRQCVFVGTTNEENWQRDQTGGRRFWPIRCGRINRARIAADRDQLFSEAVQRFKAGEKWYEMPHIATEEQQERRRQADEWEAIIKEWLASQPPQAAPPLGGLSGRQIAEDCLSIAPRDLDAGVQRRIANAMKHAGWASKHTVNGNRYWPKSMLPGYSPPPLPEPHPESHSEPDRGAASPTGQTG